jgi:hypothetical protein
MNKPRDPVLDSSQMDNLAQDYIVGRVKAGASKKTIVQELIQRGYAPSIATEIVGKVSSKHAISARKTGLLFIVIGLVVTTISIAVTVSSYNTASQQGGYYYICFGAVIFGFILTIRGILQLIRGREVK